MIKDFDLKTFSIVFFSVLICSVVVYMMISFSSYGDKSSLQQEENILEIIMDASTQCYALEGSYAPDLQYLSDNYGVIIDDGKYYYTYELAASNQPPSVTVVPRFK